VIVGSLLLILVAVTLFVLGLAGGSSMLLISSIVASLLAAGALVVGARRSAAGNGAAVAADRSSADSRADHTTGVSSRTSRNRPDSILVEGPLTDPPSEQTGRQGVPEASDEDPPDEPPAQETSADDLARVSRLAAEVVVVDGRPRYHRSDCVHLLARDSEALPVREVVELGFTPCGLCEPNSELLADIGRV